MACLLSLLAVLARPSVARACGGCFAPPAPTPDRAQVVTDHRMVLALSQRQTTLWDQIRYTGSPEDFVWVLPVANAATLRIGLADNAFVEALDQFSAPFVSATLPECWSRFSSPRPRDAGRGALFGCGAGSTGASAMPGSESTTVPRDGEAVVGPYAITVIGTKAGGGRLDEWLEQHGFMIPEGTRRAIEYYVDLQFDFIIMRLAPGAGVHQMQPVRITTRGYSPVLPLRMVAAGVGDKVGLTLMVVAPSRMEAQGFTNAVLDETQLRFDYRTNRSTWRSMFAAALARNPGRTWVIESAQNLAETSLEYGTTDLPDGGLVMGDAANDVGLLTDARPAGDASTGADALAGDGVTVLPDSGTFDIDAFVPDDAERDPDASASTEDAASTEPDAGHTAMDGSAVADAEPMGTDEDAGPVFEFDGMTPSPDGGMTMTRDAGNGGVVIPPGEAYIDRRVAFTGLSGQAVVTRMRTELNIADLDRDLVLDGSSEALLATEYIARNLDNPPPCPRTSLCAVVGTATPAMFEALIVVALVMRMRRRRAQRRAAEG